MPSAAIVAGEASGDASGAALASELRKLRPDIQIWGAGGVRMREAGVELAADFSQAGAIGIFESLKLAPRLLWELTRLKKRFLAHRPDVFIPIDFGAFNVRMGKFAREIGIPTVYYFPPGSWRKKPRNLSKLLAAADKIITPFPWSRDLLAEAGADVVFVGHPMLDRVKPSVSKSKILRDLKIEAGARIIGLLPGSRMHEIRNILPALLETSKLISSELPGLCAYLIPVSSERVMKDAFKILARWLPGRFGANKGLDDEGDPTLAQYRVVANATYDVMAHAELLITCSGTATLEAMILGTPMIIVYRGSGIMNLEYLFRKGILEDFIGMPNIVTGRDRCPELLGSRASPEAIAARAVELLTSPEKSGRMKEEMQSARAVLGQPGATNRAARIVMEVAGLL